jgi:hypothetical protein
MFLTFPICIPLLFSIYMQTLNEMRLFLWGENNAKQQQTVLEIFNQQHEGIVLLKSQLAENGVEQ